MLQFQINIWDVMLYIIAVEVERHVQNNIFVYAFKSYKYVCDSIITFINTYIYEKCQNSKMSYIILYASMFSNILSKITLQMT